MRLLTALVALALFGCAGNVETRDWARLSLAERQKALNEITQKCGLPADRVQMSEGEDVRVRPDPNDRYEAVDCLLRGLGTLRGIQLGFVGNEAYSNEVN